MRRELDVFTMLIFIQIKNHSKKHTIQGGKK